MKKFYLTAIGKVCLFLILSLIFTSSARAQKMVTYDTTFDGWNAIVTEDISLAGTDSAAGIVFFPGIGQMTTNVADLQVNGPHYLIKNGMWDGSVTLGNGVHHPFIISLQPPTGTNPATAVYPKIQAILARYRIKRNSFYFTALSQGAWQANEFITYQATPTDHTYGNLVKAVVNLEGVEPTDNTGAYQSYGSYPTKMGTWAKHSGGRELWIEGSQDWRDLLAGQQSMADSVPGSASYFMVTYGGGAHCCWNTEYEPSTTWTMPSNSNISQLVGTPQPMNVWQWMLRQGDTTMPKYATTTSTAPTASAGSAQTVTLPTNTVNLSGTAQSSTTSTVNTTSWTQVSGPNTATIGNLVTSILSSVTSAVSSLVGTASEKVSATVSGLVAGTYTFQLTVKDADGLSNTSTVTVVVDAAAPPPPPPPPPVPPTVSAGSGKAITLPASTATLTGTAVGNAGATIASVAWAEQSGPATATIASASSLSPIVSGMTKAGSYIFTLKATDSKGETTSGSVTVTVDPAATTVKTPPNVYAGANQTVVLPATTATLTGTASGNGGATIASSFWELISGPSWVKFTNEWAISTGITGLEAGTYVFELSATDNNGLTSTSYITIVVTASKTAAATAPPTVSAGSGQSITLPTSSATLKGTASGNDGATIETVSWKQASGPASVDVSSPSSTTTAVSRLTVAGSYVFTLTVTDNKGESSNASMTVTVNPSAVSIAPTVKAGANQTISLPTSEVTLNGTASGNGGATINGVYWFLINGPSFVKFGNESALSTTVAGLVAGTYVFELSATDDHDLTSTSEITVVVKAVGVAATTSTAVSGLASMVTDSTTANQLSGLSIYPNPVSSGLLNLRLGNSNNGTVLIMIYDEKGTRVQTMELEKDQWDLQKAIDVSHLANGVYIMQVVVGKTARTTTKFIKQ
jgi:Secretion system C-terminal sorting domain